MIAVHVADVLSHSLAPTLPEQAGLEIDMACLASLGLDGRVETWKARCLQDQAAGF